MNARYLIRLDDACPTMDRRRWALLEQVLDAHAIRPIVAVVPDNRDPTLAVDSPDDCFWDKARAWQAKGWTLAMHGHTHVMHATRHPILVPYYARSEFAGLGLDAQTAKIRAAWRQFLAQGIEPRIWVGPAHSFDTTTLVALREETSIRVVSDGIALDAYFQHGFHWIPQQLWRMVARSSGLWTVCLHPNQLSESEIGVLDETLRGQFRGMIIGSENVRLNRRRRSPRSWLYHHYFWWRWRRRPRENGAS